MKELTNCPYCKGDFVIKQVACQGCGTQIQGAFKTSRFNMFDPQDLFFIEMFLKNEGNIKLMEKDLGVSYPTVKSRLKNIVKTLGYHKQETAEVKRVQILQDVSEGKINATEAAKRLESLT